MYCRVSSEDQAERSTIDVQKEFAANYIKLYQLELVDYYCDNGVSGTVPMKKRPEGSRLLKDAADRRFDIVLFYKLDRIGRKTTVILDALQTLTDLDVTIRSMTEPLDTNTPTGKFIITTFSGMAELDRDSTLIRLHAGALVAAKKGKWLGGIVPFGYLTDKDGYLVINREKIPGLEYTEEDIVKLVFNMCANESKSCIEIADYINSLGVPTRYNSTRNLERRKRPGKRLKNNAAMWGPSRIQRMLRNSLYKGYRIYGLRATQRDYTPIEQQVPAIVDEEKWNKANQVLSSKSIISPKKRQGQHLLQGFLYCGHCGHTYCGYADRLKKDRQTYYYRCNGRDAYNPNWRCNDSTGINAEWIEQLALDYCASILREQTFLEGPVKPENLDNYIKAELDTIYASLKKLKDDKDTILSLYRDRKIDLDDLTSQLEKMKQEQEAMQKRMKELKQSSAEENVEKSRLTSAEFIQKFRQFFPKDYDLKNLSYQTQREVLLLFIDRITIFSEKPSDKAFYTTFRVIIQDKLGNSKTYTLAATDRLKTQQNKVGTVISSMSEKLRSLRLAKGYTQKQVANDVGLTVTTINIFENQRNCTRSAATQIKTLQKLADYYGVPFTEISKYYYADTATEDKAILQQLRDVRGVSMADLYREMGVSRVTFNHCLEGKGSASSHEKINAYLTDAKKWLKKLMQSR